MAAGRVVIVGEGVVGLKPTERQLSEQRGDGRGMGKTYRRERVRRRCRPCRRQQRVREYIQVVRGRARLFIAYGFHDGDLATV